jgi:hypothetical protein
VCAQSLQIPDPAIQVWVSVVSDAIQAFLAPFQPATAALIRDVGVQARIAAPVTLTARDRSKLASIQKRNSLNAIAFR